jgi:hypothetical protein
MAHPVRKKGAFRVGDHVRVRLAGRELPAVVIEDRGDLGPHGSQLLRVELNTQDGTGTEHEQFEVPMQALVPA